MVHQRFCSVELGCDPMRLFLALAMAFGMLSMGARAEAQPMPSRGETIVILDMSASMWGRIGEKPKLEIAQDAVRGMFSRFPATSRVGLMAYGHRKAGQCSDIQMLFPPGPVSASVVSGTIDRLKARGKTPLTEAIRQAAAALRSKEQGGTIILVTDGIETCGGDPCALAAELEAANAAFTAHVVGFDLRTASERARVACIAERTGGLFVPASNAEELAGALARTAEPRTGSTTTVAPLRGIGLRATQGPAGPNVANASFIVVREGEETPVHEGGAIRLPLKPGRYIVTATTQLSIGTVTVNVTATAPAEIVVPLTGELPRATVTPAQGVVQATGTVMVDWTGPNEPGDYLVIAPIAQGQDELETRHYSWTKDGTSLPLRVPATAGAYEVRYVLARAGRPIARAALTVTPATATLDAPAEVGGGSVVSVDWTGPKAPRSWIGIVAAGAAPGDYINGAFAYIEDAASPLQLTAPGTPGRYEIRLVEGVDGTVLVTRPLHVTATTATISGPASGMAGSPVTIVFSPAQAPQGSFISIVLPDAEASAYINGSWESIEGEKATMHLPATPGTYEMRYVLAAPGNAAVLARQTIIVTPPVASLNAPDVAMTGATISVQFTGPRGRGDYITIVAPNASGDQYTAYFSVTGDETTGELTMPILVGSYELRYVMGQADPDKAVIARRAIVVR